MTNREWAHKQLDKAFDADEFTGNVQFNFFKGSVSNVNEQKSVAVPKEIKDLEFIKK